MVDRVMVCVSSNPVAPRVIRTGARIANGSGCPWYAVYVETPQERPSRIRWRAADALRENMRLAESLGATVVRVKAARACDGLAEFARREGVTWVVLGETARSLWERLWHGSTLARLVSAVPDATVQVVPLTEL